MKINESTGKLPPAAQISERSATAEIGGAATPARALGEKVSLSGPARVLLHGGSEAPIDAGKVNQIRQQIADGSYRIDAARIADSLISTTRALFSRHH